MSYQFACPGCKVVLTLPANTPGARLTCPRCGTEMQLPGAPPPVALPVSGSPIPPPLIQKPDDFADHFGPGFLSSRKPRDLASKGMVRSIVVFVIAGAVFLGLALALVHVGRREEQRAIQPEKPRPGPMAQVQADRPDGPTLAYQAPSAVLLLALGIGLLFYFMPTFVAGFRQHHNTAAIAILNIFLGLTFIGRVVALVWAFTEVQSRKNIQYHRYRP